MMDSHPAGTPAPRRRSLTLATLLVTLAGAAQPADLPANGFNDPFFQITSAIKDCPEPLGPRHTARQRLTQSHHRAERGTTCWLKGECAAPNAYSRDHEIGSALRQRWNHFDLQEPTSLWITVQAKVVYIEGCVRRPEVAAMLERFASATPDVQLALAIVRHEGMSHPPYATWRDAVAAAARR